MNTVNEQTLNLTNSGSNKFARDYDKDPLVITDYSNFIDFTLCGASFFLRHVAFFICDKLF
ncbi:hypothetical protein CAMRE0001_0008 [Campylobacter rectus RM3267]|uniref:Uncharacterized protein n=1 Tax=Campylobacter rectus RM3267 TaxID=553218 RepID=B9D3F5_CAMRE|nr:hypothetical protein [Campylobacter rectus]EEF13425.1 hypothetical protein CAMRE0001_0008 [Campylobacter rectus RM3267]UEB47335.1 hypothetical protein LK437_10100 [Campylobacter rectus]